MSLNNESITFGKYKDKTLQDVLKDRSYCKWILNQEWFQTNYEYLYNRIKEYKPISYFVNPYEGDSTDFIDVFQYFNLNESDVKLNLTNDEKKCWLYYVHMIKDIKNKIKDKIGEENQFDIKAPTKWLQKFETETSLSREVFKTFLSAYEIPNIPYIIERIKKEGGIEYKGAKSFNIAKERSEAQESWWEFILKEKYGEDLGAQFKYENCIFDFINISTNTIFECKLGLKDFNEDQHKKYLTTLNTYRIVYLIGTECVIHLNKKQIYTSNIDKYSLYQACIPIMKNPSYLDILITDYEIIHVEDLKTLFGFSSTSVSY